MTDDDKPIEIEKVACEICLKEIPRSKAKTSEVDDYVLNFCGLECYEKWQTTDTKKKQ